MSKLLTTGNIASKKLRSSRFLSKWSRHSVIRAYATKQLRNGPAYPLFKLYRHSDGATMDVTEPDIIAGDDLDFAQGSVLSVERVYNQANTGFDDWYRSDVSRQPVYVESGSYVRTNDSGWPTIFPQRSHYDAFYDTPNTPHDLSNGICFFTYQATPPSQQARNFMGSIDKFLLPDGGDFRINLTGQAEKAVIMNIDSKTIYPRNAGVSDTFKGTAIRVDTAAISTWSAAYISATSEDDLITAANIKILYGGVDQTIGSHNIFGVPSSDPHFTSFDNDNISFYASVAFVALLTFNSAISDEDMIAMDSELTDLCS